MNKENIGIIITITLISLFFLWICGITYYGYSPDDWKGCKYRELSPFNEYPTLYPSWIKVFVWSQNRTYFDSYYTNGNQVTIQDYWYIDGLMWKKCDGNFTFISNDGFIPTEVKDNNKAVQIINQDCK